MAFTTRSLLSRVALFRPDKDEAVALFAIQEAARNICRYTQLATETLTPVSVAAGTLSVTTASATPTTREVIRVESVRYAPVPPTGSSLGTWDATTAAPALTTTYGAFYIVSVAGNGYGVGDVIWSNGSAWVKIPLSDYVEAQEDSKPRIESLYLSPQSGTGTPAHWAQENGTVFFYPKLSGDYPVQYVISYVPVGEFDTVGLPHEAEDVVVAGALEFMYKLPGEGANPTQSMIEAKKFAAGKDNLRSLHYLGFGGDLVQTPPSFTGRSNPAGPFQLSPRYL